MKFFPLEGNMFIVPQDRCSEPPVARQKRPTDVARFLRKFCVSARHDVTNCLLSLGLERYSHYFPEKHPNIHFLHDAVSRSLIINNPPPSTRPSKRTISAPTKRYSNVVATEGVKACVREGRAKQRSTTEAPESQTARKLVCPPQGHRELGVQADFVVDQPPRKSQDVSCNTLTLQKTWAIDTLPTASCDVTLKSSCQREDHRDIDGTRLFSDELIQNLKYIIEDTKGVRLNPILVATTLPEALASMVERPGFSTLYRALLLQYHITAS